MFIVGAKERSDDCVVLPWYPVAAYTTREAAERHCKEANCEEIRIHREVLSKGIKGSAENKWDKVNRIRKNIRVLYEVIELPTYDNILQYKLSNE